MKRLTTAHYTELIALAVKHFWETRTTQSNDPKKLDQGNRSSVTGGKQLDGLINVLVKVALDLGVPESCIFTKDSTLPGFFRPSKNWDFIILTPQKQLIAVVECKSQVGSFGNNFNNRTEEALGSAADLWTAFRENSFLQKQAPWLGYVLLIENTQQSASPVRLVEPHFKVRAEFQNTSYLDRYILFCQKLMLERQYSATHY
jgi:Restriction endonuclease XhoI